jgi:hypothetical protein
MRFFLRLDPGFAVESRRMQRLTLSLFARGANHLLTEIVIRFTTLRPKAGAPPAFAVPIFAAGSRTSFATGIEPAIF